MMAELKAHFHNSTLRERIVEHVFIGEALRTLWRRGVTDAEVLRPEFDAHGYDLVMGRGSVVRHIQFKTGLGVRPGMVSVARSLADKPSGCVIWISVTPDLNMGPYWWFGGAPGEPLPDISNMRSPKQTRANAQGFKAARINHRLVPCSRFERLISLDEVLETLFGPLPSGSPPIVTEEEPA